MRSLIAVFAAFWLASVVNVSAVITNGGGTLEEPSVLDYVGSVGGASGVYLGFVNGSYWVLTASHVGAGSFMSGSEGPFVCLGTVDFGSLDLLLLKIDVPPDSALAQLAPLTIGSSFTDSTSVVIAGNGGTNQSNTLSYWTTNPWSETTQGASTYSGYKFDNGSELGWGKDKGYKATDSGSGTHFIVTEFTTADGSGQAVLGDSGGGMFVQKGTSWEIVGLLVGRQGVDGQPEHSTVAVFGEYSAGIDLTFYAADIHAAMIPEASTMGLFLSALLAGGGLVGGRRFLRRAPKAEREW